MLQYRCPQCGTIQVSSQPLSEVHCQQCGCVFHPTYQGDGSQQQYQQQGQPYQQPYPHNPNDVFQSGPSGKSRGVAALLAIFLGSLGIQYFYLGKSTAGIVCLCISIFSCGILAGVLGLLTLIQGIIMLTMSEQDFERKYINNPATFVF